MNGEQTLIKLRRMRPHVKVLLTSGHSEQDVSQIFAGKKASAFIQKPFLPSELIDRIEQACDGARARPHPEVERSTPDRV